jgi:virginiamycin B lyase
MNTQAKRRALLAAVTSLLLLVAASPAAAHVYWANSWDDAIGRAIGGGIGIDQTFITDAVDPNGVAVDDRYVYWADYLNYTIGRAHLDGSADDPAFIPDLTNPTGVAVDDTYIYWANFESGSIGRANLDGSGVNDGFIAADAIGVAVDDAHIYWADAEGNAIGRANLDGTDVNGRFITGTSFPVGVTIDDAHVYWTNNNNDTIGRANLDGSGARQSFIAHATNPRGIAVDGAHLYWTDYVDGEIGRANLDGTCRNADFIKTRKYPDGLAVTPVGASAGRPPTGTFPAKITVQSARVRSGRLDVRAGITNRADGHVDLSYHAGVETRCYRASIKDGAIRLSRRLTAAQRRKRSGTLTLSYDGDTTVLSDHISLRASNRPARLTRDAALIDDSGRLHVSGTITDRARGVVHIRFDYTATGGLAKSADYTAPIEDGRWTLVAPLPADAASAGGQLSIQFTGSAARRIQGQQLTKTVTP